jgi:hypothetical protein
MAFAEGAKLVRVAGGPVSFYEKYQTTTLYVQKSFGDSVNTITVSNDSTTDTVYLSYDGATVDGDLTTGESVTLNSKGKNSIYISALAGGGYVRIWCW